MNHPVLLDRDSEAQLPPHYTLVTTERDFLAKALSGSPLMICGTRLCDWADAFYRGRAYPVVLASSPIRELQQICPGLRGEQAAALRMRLGDQYHRLPKPVTVSSLLQVLYPSSFWQHDPTLDHGATWLEWLWRVQPEDTIRPLLQYQAAQWAAETDHRTPYETVDAEGAASVLRSWFSIDQTGLAAALPVFPKTVPAEWIGIARETWEERIIASDGVYGLALLERALPRELYALVTQLTFDFYQSHPQDLTEERCTLLAPQLTIDQQIQLRQYLPPLPPEPLPASPQKVLDWYLSSYLPYRLWQTRYEPDANARQIVDASAAAFADWYLTEYPKALSGSPMQRLLSFRQIAQHAQASQGTVTLVVVLDGLHVADAEKVQRELITRTKRLTTTVTTQMFVPVPTVTDFCKSALIAGVTPKNAPPVAAIPGIISGNKKPSTTLSQAKKGSIYVWNFAEPDKTYHQVTSDTQNNAIKSKLNALADRILEAVEETSVDQTLTVVITTDHGRFLGVTPRTLAVPPLMVSHGRAAWGLTSHQYPQEGYLKQGDIVYLHAERFGLPQDAAVALSAQAFVQNDGKTGSEYYTHGGLYPEEVIAPWIVLERDFEVPLLKIRLEGHAFAGQAGTLNIEVVNVSSVAVHLSEIRVTSLELNHVLPLDKEISAKSKQAFSLTLSPWPTAAQVSSVQALCTATMSNGRRFTIKSEVLLQVDTMYAQTRPNLLDEFEDLDS